MRFTRQMTDPDTGAAVKEGTPEYVHVALRQLEARVQQMYDNELAIDDALSALLEALEGMVGEHKMGPPNVPGSLHRARVSLERVIW